MNLWNLGVQPTETIEKPRLRKLYEHPPEERPVVVEPEPVPGDRRRGKRPYTRAGKNKIRRHSVSLSVSEEEENILRTHAVKLDMSFSEWARQVLFRALGRRLPSRGGGDE